MRKFTFLPGIVVLIALLLAVFIGCRKTDQKPVEPIAAETT